MAARGRCWRWGVVGVAGVVLLARTAVAGFAGKDLLVPGVARTTGAFGSDWYTTLWLTNLSATTPTRVELRFLRKDQANVLTPGPITETLAAGETRRYDNVVWTLFKASQTSGAIWVKADHDVLAASRTFDMRGGADGGDSRGHFFGGIPTFFAVGPQESTVLQGVTQGGREPFRYNFGMVETSGQSAVVSVTLLGEDGATLGSKVYTLREREVRQLGVHDILPGVTTANAVIRATVTSTTGRVMLYGTQMPNGSSDSAGFEMLFPGRVLAGADQGSAPGLAAGAAANAAAVIDKVFAIAPTIALLGSYDESTGWWTVELNLRTTASATVQVRFQDATGAPGKLYNPLTTTSIRTRGQVTGTLGRLDFDLVISGTNQGSHDLTVNGSGSATSGAVEGSFAVTNLVQPKSAHYPTGGGFLVMSGPVVVTVAFNGTEIATGTYTVGLLTRQFTINLSTGEVTFL